MYYESGPLNYLIQVHMGAYSSDLHWPMEAEIVAQVELIITNRDNSGGLL